MVVGAGSTAAAGEGWVAGPVVLVAGVGVGFGAAGRVAGRRRVWAEITLSPTAKTRTEIINLLKVMFGLLSG